MALNPLRPVLRTVHNGSISTVRAEVSVPPGGELTVPEVVADQLQRDHGAFKDGPAGDGLLDQLYPPVDDGPPAEAEAEAEAVAEPEPEPVKRRPKKAR